MKAKREKKAVERVPLKYYAQAKKLRRAVKDRMASGGKFGAVEIHASILCNGILGEEE